MNCKYTNYKRKEWLVKLKKLKFNMYVENVNKMATHQLNCPTTIQPISKYQQLLTVIGSPEGLAMINWLN